MKIEIRDISKKYRKNQVLNGVNISANEGTCIGILGANGSGKSTLFAILSGMLKADGGTLCLNGKRVDDKEREKLIGLVPQRPPLFEELTAKDNLRLWYTSEQMKEELDAGVLAMLGIDAFLNVPVAKMSGGMKKRLAIGCAVANQPKILLLDEPSAALDLICKERIVNYLLEYKAAGNIIFLATHDVNEIEICDELYILKNGKAVPIKYDGNVHRLVGQL